MAAAAAAASLRSGDPQESEAGCCFLMSLVLHLAFLRKQMFEFAPFTLKRLSDGGRAPLAVSSYEVPPTYTRYQDAERTTTCVFINTEL